MVLTGSRWGDSGRLPSSFLTNGRVSLQLSKSCCSVITLVTFLLLVGSSFSTTAEMVQRELEKHFPGVDYTIDDFLSEFNDYKGHRSPELRLLRKTFSKQDSVISASKYRELLRKALDGTFLDDLDTAFNRQSGDKLDRIKTPQLSKRMRRLVKSFVDEKSSKQEVFRLKDYYLDVYEHGFFDWARNQGQRKFHKILDDQHHTDL